MKELSTEEKAKAYDEAYKKVAIRFGSNVADEIFPELKESEDERMRTMAIKAIRIPEARSCIKNWGINPDDVIAWLEKQGQTFTKKDVDDAYLKGVCDAKQELEKQGEQKPAWSEEDEKMIRGLIVICDEWTTWHSFYPIENCEIEKLKNWLKSLKDRVQPKQEWSEEDKEQLDRALYMMEQLDMTKSWDDVYNWLKSLKDKVQPQPKREWSEEDKAILEKCIGAVKVSCYSYSFKSEAENWLKSLRPQNRWKPSDEQMADLWNMVCECRPADQQLLQDLYFGLKTLRGE